MRFDIITIFPNLFNDFKNESLLARAQAKKLIKITAHNLRDWTTDRHHTVDGKPFGGGVGMVLKVEPILKAVTSVQLLGSSKKLKTSAKGGSASGGKKSKVILFSPRGKKFDQATAKRWAKLDQLVMISGRYEGVDERIADHLADEVVSIGDYVLFGGEVPAMVVIETIARLIPGVIAKAESATKADHAQYTRPETIKIGGKLRTVPKVLLSGDHAKISTWREKEGS